MLTGLKTIKVCVAYQFGDQELRGEMPATIEDFEKCTPIYETLSGFDEDISKCTKFEELPENAKAYIRFIENHLHLPITWVGVGAGRDEIILKEGFI